MHEVPLRLRQEVKPQTFIHERLPLSDALSLCNSFKLIKTPLYLHIVKFRYVTFTLKCNHTIWNMLLNYTIGRDNELSLIVLYLPLLRATCVMLCIYV